MSSVMTVGLQWSEGGLVMQKGLSISKALSSHYHSPCKDRQPLDSCHISVREWIRKTSSLPHQGRRRKHLTLWVTLLHHHAQFHVVTNKTPDEIEKLQFMFSNGLRE